MNNEKSFSKCFNQPSEINKNTNYLVPGVTKKLLEKYKPKMHLTYSDSVSYKNSNQKLT